MDTATSAAQSDGTVPWRDVIERLDRLRRSLVWVVITLLGGTAAGWAVADRLFAFFSQPLTIALQEAGRDPRLVFTNLSDPFVIYFSISMLGGAVLALPVLMSVFWRLVAPLGLGRSLTKAAAFVVCSTALFILGLAFGHPRPAESGTPGHPPRGWSPRHPRAGPKHR